MKYEEIWTAAELSRVWLDTAAHCTVCHVHSTRHILGKLITKNLVKIYDKKLDVTKWLQGGPKKVSHKLLSISLPNIDRFSHFHWHILWKISYNMVTKYTTTFSLHHCEIKICKIHQYLVTIWTRVWSISFGPSCTTALSSLHMFTNTRIVSKTIKRVDIEMLTLLWWLVTTILQTAIKQAISNTIK